MTYQITRADEQWTYYTMIADDLLHRDSRWLITLWQQMTYYTMIADGLLHHDSRWLITLW